MSFLRFLIAWANAPYTVVFGIVGLFALLSASGLLGLLGGGQGDHDGGDDVDGADADGHDVDGHETEADHDGGHDDSDHDADHDEDAGRAGLASFLLAPLGIGKLPFSLIWQVFGATFALTGLGLNARYLDLGHGPPLVSLAWTMPIALTAGYGVVAALARLLGPVLVNKLAEATSRAELVGHVGTVISTKVDEAFGEVRFRDKTGHDLRVVCKLARGHAPANEKEEVVVVDHDEKAGVLYVARLDEGLEEGLEEEQAPEEKEEEEGKRNDVRG